MEGDAFMENIVKNQKKGRFVLTGSVWYLSFSQKNKEGISVCFVKNADAI